MREILFRAKSNQTWYYGYVYPDYESPRRNIWRIATPNEDILMIDTNTICEWTGLTDKNNVKIFEGDIVKTNDERIKHISCTDTFVIKFINGNYYICYTDIIADDDTICTLRCWSDKSEESVIEVIGNIYDNPDILNAV